MPVNKYALLRYRIIDRKISSKYKPFPNKEDLRQACEEELYGSTGDKISVSTIDKDLYAMRNESNLGYYAPIAYHKLHKGYYYTDPDYSIQELPLSESEIEAIQFAANTLSQFRNLEMFSSSEAAIDKILDRFNLSPRNEPVEMAPFVQFETVESYKGGKHLAGILGAIRAGKIISFDYQKYIDGKKSHYTLHPYLLKEYRNRWYVIGFNPDKKAVVVFGLDRIVGKVKTTDMDFSRLPSFDPDVYFKHSMGITAVNEEPRRIVLSFSPLSGKYVQSQPLHASQKIIRNDEVSFDVALYLSVTPELIMTILSYGSNVRVKEPLSLQKKIANILEQSLNYYRDI